MSLSRSHFSLKRDYFAIAIAIETLEGAGVVPPAAGSLVLELQPPVETTTPVRRDDARAASIAFPRGASILVAVALSPPPQASSGPTLDLLLPRSAFDHVADHVGGRRITALSLQSGAARDDAVLAHLGAGLNHAMALNPIDEGLLSDLALALNLHIAQRYGQMEPLALAAPGGLSSWQLRLARKRLDQHLDQEISLEALAAECGLSPSHFTRAFASSTGLTPHRWLMQRRIETAKDLILRTDLPLAQIALDCGFSDQSHFTRVFSSLTGFTPARWRSAQEQVWAADDSALACG
jgi:AraC-like DNA-binding protein